MVGGKFQCKTTGCNHHQTLQLLEISITLGVMEQVVIKTNICLLLMTIAVTRPKGYGAGVGYKQSRCHGAGGDDYKTNTWIRIMA